ncbi:hypothetical protein Tco_1541448 [Tanacetum coccineum]
MLESSSGNHGGQSSSDKSLAGNEGDMTLQSIDPKDKGKKKIEEEDESKTNLEDNPEAKHTFNNLARDEEDGYKVVIGMGNKEERKRLAEKEANKDLALHMNMTSFKQNWKLIDLLALMTSR